MLLCTETQRLLISVPSGELCNVAMTFLPAPQANERVSRLWEGVNGQALALATAACAGQPEVTSEWSCDTQYVNVKHDKPFIKQNKTKKIIELCAWSIGNNTLIAETLQSINDTPPPGGEAWILKQPFMLWHPVLLPTIDTLYNYVNSLESAASISSPFTARSPSNTRWVTYGGRITHWRNSK